MTCSSPAMKKKMYSTIKGQFWGKKIWLLHGAYI